MSIVNTASNKNHKDYLLAALIYGVLVLLFFYPVISGKIVTQTDYLNFISPWDSTKPAALTVPSNPHLQDQSTEFLPFFQEAKKQIFAGEFPLWNPYIFVGNPLWANTQSALMYPLNWFHYLLPPPLGFTISSLLKLFFGCFFTYVFARKIKLNHEPALFAGVAFGFCSFTVFWLNHPHTNVICLIPLCFYMVERMLEEPDARNRAWFALVVALTLIAGHVEIAFLTAVGCGLYFLLRLIQIKQLSFTALKNFFMVYLFGLLLASILVIPFVEFLFHTAVWEERGAGLQVNIPWTGFINLLMGDFFVFDGWDQNQIGFHAFSPYAGMLCVPLAFYGLLNQIKKSWPLLVFTIFCLAVVFGINPVFYLVKSLPLFNHLPLFYFSILTAFGLVIMAAIGVQHALDNPTVKQHIMYLAIAIVLLFVGLYFFWAPGSLAVYVKSSALLAASVKSFSWWVLGLLMVCLLLIVWAHKYQKMVFLVFIVLIYGDLWHHGHDWNPVVEKATAMPQHTPGSVKFLKQNSEPFRTVAYDLIFKPSTNMLAEIHDIRGYDVPVINRYHQFFNKALKGKDAYWYYDFKRFDASVLPLFDVLNVRYLLSKKNLEAQLPQQVVPVYKQEINIYENLNAKGMAYWANQELWVTNEQQALETVIENKDKLKHMVVLEGHGKKHSLVSNQNQKSYASQKVSYNSISSQTIEMTVETPVNAWLVLVQNYYPGWQARVDGKETEIFAANYVLQAIKIPAGTHQVTFTYQPWSFTLGWVLSLISLLLVIWIIRKKTK